MPKEWRASKRIKQAARHLRRDLTPAEHRLWKVLRRRQVAGLYFRRQHPIERVVVDFCCVEKRLIIEVDGKVHDYTGDHDRDRQAWLEDRGYRVLRFTNDEIMGNLDGVVDVIRQAVSDDMST